MCEMDTDSAYLAISGESLDELIRPDKREVYETEKIDWFPRDDTDAHKAFDKRTPGLFKIEWEGRGIVALCSKTYFRFGDQNKVSCKGLNKKTNEITKEKYLNVLRLQAPGSGINRGFRMRDGDMYTYEQTKTAFTYLYPKRKVHEDGRSTTYLDLWSLTADFALSSDKYWNFKVKFLMNFVAVSIPFSCLLCVCFYLFLIMFTLLKCVYAFKIWQ